MAVNEELLKKLRSIFNLNIYEVKVWTSLLSKGTATAGELSDMSNVPRSRSYDVLESLEKKGFIIMKLGRPIKYLAVTPSEIVKRVKRSVEEKAQYEVKAIEDVQKTDVFQELNLLYSQGIVSVDPTTIAGSFKGRSSIYDHLSNLIESAQKEVVIATTSDGLVRKVENLKPIFKKLNAKKVKIKIAAPLKTDKAKEAAHEIKDIAEVKDVDPNSRFILVDGKDLLFMVSSDKTTHESSDVGIWVNTPFFGGALRTMFDSIWNK